jgi:predicted DCC family thiol-disulfide oxidoreductase YuxK
LVVASSQTPAIILYDGECNVCSGSVRFILSRDPRGLFRFAPLQSAAGARLRASCGRPADSLGSLILVEDGRCYERSDALLRITARLGLPWNLAALLRIVPRALRDAFYDWFAARRYRWFGKKEVCDVPPVDWRERFLE